MATELTKAFASEQYEDAIYRRWEESGFFNPDACVERGVAKADAPAFSIVLPPPNVTGTLHMGHAAMLAIEDTMVRYHRMKRERVLWVPGTDHAAIATQSKVESLLMEEEGKTRHDLGREQFLDRVNQFARSSHDTIVNQCKKMGASLDWSREAFTLDDARSLAVRTVFKKMYDDGLIYRGARLVNWDPAMQSNVADDEIEWKEVKEPFYYFQYGPFVIGTARPETKFGDKYVVMHPEDERYAMYSHGQKIGPFEWINGPVTATIIKDPVADMNFGSGAMTITPWHDAVDFDVATRHQLDKEQVIDLQGRLLPIAGEFAGMTIDEARPKLVEKLRRKGLLMKVDEAYVHNVAVNYRGQGKIEPQIREQWFVDVNKKFSVTDDKLSGVKKGQEASLKELMQQVLREKQIEIIPDRFHKTYFQWIDNLRDWCISRQIWYGHRIPVYYCRGIQGKKDNSPCERPIVSVDDVGVCPRCGGAVEQDPDTLDTWFSSGLWTFSTLGWPKHTVDFSTFHPTSVLETGYDILFFWVARMILMTTYVFGDIPFHTVYLHGLVRDAEGKKMSKTLGNIINPLDMIEKYGTDATRLSLLIGSTPGNDVKLSEEKIAGFRNFTNKLWNIARFILINMNGKNIGRNEGLAAAKSLADRWVLYRLEYVKSTVTKLIEQMQFSYAGELLRQFTWDELADWYLEIAKVEGGKSDLLDYVLHTILKLWHPFMPFVTEAIWQEMYGNNALLMIEGWPEVSKELLDNGSDAEKNFSLLRDMVVGIRNMRSEHGIPPRQKLTVMALSEKHADLIRENGAWIRALARLDHLICDANLGLSSSQKNMVQFQVGDIQIHIMLSTFDSADAEKQKIRLQKEIDDIVPYVQSLEKKLANAQFVQHAPPAVVDGEKKKLEEAKTRWEKIQRQLSTLL